VVQPFAQAAFDLLIGLIGVLAAEPLAHQLDAGLVEIEGDPQTLA